jgi:hypothetical protein
LIQACSTAQSVLALHPAAQLPIRQSCPVGHWLSAAHLRRHRPWTQDSPQLHSLFLAHDLEQKPELQVPEEQSPLAAHLVGVMAHPT